VARQRIGAGDDGADRALPGQRARRPRPSPAYAQAKGLDLGGRIQPDAELVRFSENLLAGAIGASVGRG